MSSYCINTYLFTCFSSYFLKDFTQMNICELLFNRFYRQLTNNKTMKYSTHIKYKKKQVMAWENWKWIFFFFNHAVLSFCVQCCQCKSLCVNRTATMHFRVHWGNPASCVSVFPSLFPNRCIPSILPIFPWDQRLLQCTGPSKGLKKSSLLIRQASVPYCLPRSCPKHPFL